MAKKLNIQEFVYSYNGEDLVNASLECQFRKYNIKEYVNKEFIKSSKPLITFNLSAEDKNKKEYTFTFGISGDLDELNKLDDKTVNINDKIFQGETMLYNPYTDTWKFIDEPTDNIYQKTVNYYLKKLENNKFIFKCQLDIENIFIWFEVDFN